MKFLWIVFVLYVLSVSLYADEVVIDHAYLRKLSEYDNGTIHLFLKNNSSSKIRIKNVYLNDELLKKLPNELVVWTQSILNPIPPNNISDVMIKLSHASEKLMKIEVELDNQQKLSRVIQPIPSPLRFTFVGFSKQLDKLYIYIENSGIEAIPIEKLYINTQDISNLIINPFSSINPQQKKCIIVKLNQSLNWGDYITLKLESEGEAIAETLVRVYRYFPIQSWDKDKRKKELFFNLNNILMPYPKSKNEFEIFQKAPLFKTYHVYDDPACKDNKKGILGRNAQKVIHRTNICRIDKRHPSAIYMCEYEKPKNYFVYGETADLIMANPYEFSYKREKLEKDGYFISLAKLASEPRPLFAISEAFKRETVEGSNRFPTPEELRLIVYSEIANGAKGILYFRKHYTEGQGYEKAPELEAEIKNINKELQKLKNYLIIGELLPLANTDNPQVDVNAILCGDKGIVLILINRDYQNSFDKLPYFIFNRKQNVKISINIPDWLKINEVYEVESKLMPLTFNQKKEQAILDIGCIDIVKAIILVAE